MAKLAEVKARNAPLIKQYDALIGEEAERKERRAEAERAKRKEREAEKAAEKEAGEAAAATAAAEEKAAREAKAVRKAERAKEEARKRAAAADDDDGDDGGGSGGRAVKRVRLDDDDDGGDDADDEAPSAAASAAKREQLEASRRTACACAERLTGAMAVEGGAVDDDAVVSALTELEGITMDADILLSSGCARHRIHSSPPQPLHAAHRLLVAATAHRLRRPRRSHSAVTWHTRCVARACTGVIVHVRVRVAPRGVGRARWSTRSGRRRRRTRHAPSS